MILHCCCLVYAGCCSLYMQLYVQIPWCYFVYAGCSSPCIFRYIPFEIELVFFKTSYLALFFTSDKTYDKTATFFQCWGITWRVSVHFPLHEPCSLWPFLPWRHTSHPLHSALKLEKLCKKYVCVTNGCTNTSKRLKLTF